MALILVVDDEDDFRAVLTHILTRAGHEVATASGGLEGLDQLRRRRPRLVLCDLSMPDITGIELVRRAREAGDETPILMLTVRSQMTSVSEAMASGVTDYLLKPFDEAELLARVGRAMSR